jgi:hypothetical protein
MRVKVHVKKYVQVELTVDELADALRYLTRLQQEQAKLPDGVEPSLRLITSKFDYAYVLTQRAQDTTRKEKAV